ncbi:HlyD family secretion protein [Paenibacillus sp. UNCCL117]|uniref:HlyD family secretion protein n=1 Tax=unclassified Paenibacillus TaxID=185978 RepID=UPI00088DE039|nr:MULTISPECIES: HlyD family efflux transporter periplasmic adaptor subunit [unclassified Paenibacillus]SDC67245.1 HlyD family secretion protein [Paenibacillus sp. cl123]SFW23255.1 HlyD family secretion protein [Paenibacillus sp. UNCCL117]
MRFIRPVVYSVMAVAIGTGGFLLSSKQAAGSTQIGLQSHPTAYIESNEVGASFKIGGRITEVLVKEGDAVTKGQPLARLQSTELEAKVSQAKAAVALAQGKIAEAQGATATAQAKKQQAAAGVSATEQAAEQQVAQAEAAVKAAQAKVDALHNGARPEEKQQAEIQYQAAQEVYTVAEQNLKRMQTLLEQGLIAQAEVDKVKVSHQEAKAKLELAEQQRNLVNQGPREEEVRGAEALLEQAKAALGLAQAGRAQVLVRQGDVAAAEAAIQQAQGAIQSASSGEQQAKAAQQEAETYQSYTELVAPADGLILSQSAQTGELVGSGFPVFSIQATDAQWAKFYMTEKAVAGLKLNDPVKLKLLATGEEVTGTVKSIAAAPDFAVKKATQTSGETDVRSFGVKIELPKLPDSAVIGMTLQWIGVTEG